MTSFDDVEIDETNVQPRCPCVVLLDTSTSMAGTRIDALNAGLKLLEKDIKKDNLARQRVEVAIVTFDSEVKVIQPFVTAERFSAPTLLAQGSTRMALGINRALDMVEEIKRKMKSSGIEYYRPWVMLITDGGPTDPATDVDAVAARVREAERKKEVAFFAIGVEGADMECLRKITDGPQVLKGLKFQELFLWLSSSVKRVSASQLDQQVPLEPINKWTHYG